MADHLDGMTLIGAKGGGSAIIEAQLAILGVPYAHQYLDWDGLHDPNGPLAKMNPACEIPALLLQDGSVMTESAAITLWLSAERPEGGLVPKAGTPEYPEFLRWLIWLVASVYPTFSYGDHPERWLGDEAAARQLKTATDKRREGMWQQLESATAPAPWLLGDAMTALDVYIAVMTRWHPRRNWFEKYCPKLFGVATRMDSLPELAEVWERNFAP